MNMEVKGEVALKKQKAMETEISDIVEIIPRGEEVAPDQPIRITFNTEMDADVANGINIRL